VKLYNNPRDKRIFVPKQGGGVVLNFGHAIAWWIVITMTIFPLIVVTAMTIAVLS
jgi:uncharacterized membrane protein